MLAKLHLARLCHFNFVNPPQERAAAPPSRGYLIIFVYIAN